MEMRDERESLTCFSQREREREREREVLLRCRVCLVVCLVVLLGRIAAAAEKESVDFFFCLPQPACQPCLVRLNLSAL